MRYIIITLFILLFSDTSIYGQQWARERHHAIAGLGAAGFLGDLGGADNIGSMGPRDYDFRATMPSAMIGYRYYLLENFAARANITYGIVSSDDNLTNEPYRNNRNIHFRSHIIELSTVGEFFFFTAERTGARYRRVTRSRGWLGYNISAYAFGGLAVFYFNPEAEFAKDRYMELEHKSVEYKDLPDDGWYKLRPLRTEGQGIIPTRQMYSQFQVSMPLGLGATFQITSELSIGFEIGVRKTWTDYIDDVSTTYIDPAIYSHEWNDLERIALAEYFSNPTKNDLGSNVTAPGQQRGGPEYNDFYMFSFISVSYKIPALGPGYGVPRF